MVRSVPCLNATCWEHVFTTVSNYDINKAFFSIKDNKYLGLDYYSSLFFQKSWDLVIEDFCAVVKDFFVSKKLLKQINHFIKAMIPKSANAYTPNDYREMSL